METAEPTIEDKEWDYIPRKVKPCAAQVLRAA
jgi:hypothetical protein